MKRISFVISAVAMIVLSGCSNKPGISDVETQVTEAWSACKLVKPVSFKKVNGIDNGNSYQMAVSFKLEMTRDLAEEGIWDTKIPTPKGVDVNLNSMSYQEVVAYQNQQAALNEPYRAAKKRLQDFYANNCPGELGDYFQKVGVANKKYGAPLQKGDTFDIDTEFTLHKTENGWML